MYLNRIDNYDSGYDVLRSYDSNRPPFGRRVCRRTDRHRTYNYDSRDGDRGGEVDEGRMGREKRGRRGRTEKGKKKGDPGDAIANTRASAMSDGIGWYYLHSII